jgi:hypothetical protein
MGVFFYLARGSVSSTVKEMVPLFPSGATVRAGNNGRLTVMVTPSFSNILLCAKNVRS